jgi:hypothetical protein
MKTTTIVPLVALLSAAQVLGCDTDTKSTAPSASASSSALRAAPTVTVTEIHAAPKVESKLMVSMDDSSAYVAGNRVDLGGPDPQGRIRAELAARSDLPDGSISLEIARNAKAPRVASLITLLRSLKAKEARIRTPDRTSKVAETTMILADRTAACSVAGWIAKDMSILVWPASGGTPKRAVKGMAGPDMTIGADLVGKTLGTCETKMLAVGGDEGVIWGLVYDLFLASSRDGGKVQRLMLGEEITPGKKLAP